MYRDKILTSEYYSKTFERSNSGFAAIYRDYIVYVLVMLHRIPLEIEFHLSTAGLISIRPREFHRFLGLRNQLSLSLVNVRRDPPRKTLKAPRTEKIRIEMEQGTRVRRDRVCNLYTLEHLVRRSVIDRF